MEGSAAYKIENREQSLLEKIRDEVFDSILFENILSAYEADLLDTGYSREQVQSFFSILNNLEEREQKKILSLAFEQRRLLFKNYLEEINTDKITLQDFIHEILEIATEHNYDIGFHVTNHRIEKEVNRDKRVVWNIKGKEKDHRDNDLPMAFYSKQYRHLYGKKGYHYIYTVRALPDHRTDGNWFRAPMLSIVSELAIEPDKLIERIQKEVVKRKQETS